MKNVLKSLLPSFLVRYFTVGHERSIAAKRNVLFSFLFKGGSIAITFLLVPLTINYLDDTKYGIWLTITSFIAWFTFFDMGLGNGLRNKLAEVKVDGNVELEKGYISSAYFTITTFSIGLLLAFFVANYFIDWTVVFNTSKELREELSTLMLVIVAFFCLQLILKLITTIYLADQKSATLELINFFTQFLSLIAIWAIAKVGQGSLFVFGVLFSSIPVLILLVVNLLAFNSRKYKAYTPKIKFWKKIYVKDIFGLGIKFFVTQIAALILFSTDNMIITQLYGPKEVAVYNIAFKYFSIALMIFTIIITPYWTAITDAFVKSDFEWIKKTINGILKIWMLIVILLLVMLLVADYVYSVWVGDRFVIPFSLSLIMVVYFGILTFNTIYSNFINGIGKLRLQMITAVMTIVLNIPLSIFFSKYLELGVVGVVIGTCICMGYSIVLKPMQYYKIINGTAKGVWIK